eukprot:TRINITY_DN2273_c0_g1_i1.p1 TRINITY_DN2273_c0_g1~~TRINITY_DN2273_c0_g1_i1.p1  ORF type:complete len:300 (+),score=53.11 TRINITY_DN2273_c0_g1_i1:70-969(+)
MKILALICLAALCFTLASAYSIPISNEDQVSNEDQAPNGWSVIQSLSYLYYSYAAYCPQTALSAWTCTWCKQKGVSNFKPTAFPYDDKTKTLGYVGYNPDNNTIFIVFRGSSNIQNWIDVDLRFFEVAPYGGNPDILVHSGFYYAYGNLSSQVRSAVSALKSKYPTANMAITGHSLGAALSIFCALDMIGIYPSSTIIINNFGEPRCGNKAFADYYHSFTHLVTWRVTNNRDIVPNLPLKSMGFFHHPTEIWERTNTTTKDQYYKTCSSTNGEDQTCSASVVQDSVDDHLHYMGLYESC